MVRAVIYARFSSEGQREESIEDQVRNCQRLCAEKGWTVVGEYHDRAMSGASPLRPDYQRLCADARARKFDVVASEALDRLSRDQATIASLYKVLQFNEIVIFTRSEGEVNELHIGLKGTMNQMFLKDLALKTRRGLEGRVRQGKSGGGNAFGYRVVKQRAADGQELCGDRAVIEAEADVIRRIFSEFAAGASPRAIAKRLNAEGVRGPRGNAWRDTTIRGHATRRTGILRNDLYDGRLVWNKQTYVKDPDTGRRLARVNAAAEVIESPVHHLRIVDAQCWAAVQSRLDGIRNTRSAAKQRETRFWEQRRPKHLLTGLMFCGCCSDAMASTGKDYVACTRARSGAGCSNGKSVRRGLIEQAVLEGLKDRLMAPALVAEFIKAFHEEANIQRAGDAQRHRDAASELARVTKKLQGMYDAIADGLRTPGLKDQLIELEGRQAKLKLDAEAAPPTVARFHPKLSEVYRDRVAQLHGSLTKDDAVAKTEAIEVLRTLVERVTIRPDGNGHIIELVGDIVNLLTLPGSKVPNAMKGSVKVVAGARNGYYSTGLVCGSLCEDHDQRFWGRLLITINSPPKITSIRSVCWLSGRPTCDAFAANPRPMFRATTLPFRSAIGRSA
jgi:site-specific DNA recombinase